MFDILCGVCGGKMNENFWCETCGMAFEKGFLKEFLKDNYKDKIKHIEVLNEYGVKISFEFL